LIFFEAELPTTKKHPSRFPPAAIGASLKVRFLELYKVDASLKKHYRY